MKWHHLQKKFLNYFITCYYHAVNILKVDLLECLKIYTACSYRTGHDNSLDVHINFGTSTKLK